MLSIYRPLYDIQTVKLSQRSNHLLSICSCSDYTFEGIVDVVSVEVDPALIVDRRIIIRDAIFCDNNLRVTVVVLDEL